jgi:ABC-type Fe3+/spermidine/putrescine transport system ATPase subunit
MSDLRDLEVENLSKRFGDALAVGEVSFSLAKGEFLSLLGPSGCGKTTTLRMIAGFVSPDTGSIRLRGKDIADDPPYRRDVGLLFQSYALFPHMTVLENVAFGPKMRGAGRGQMREKARWALDLVRLPSLEDRKPSQLSGGQQQRVAVARVLAAGASILLLDEPFSNLDAKLRKHMQEDLRELQLRLGIGTIHVTHDQEEAMSMSDRLIIMQSGRIEQEGPAAEVYENPRNGFVAGFMGRTNEIPVKIKAYDLEGTTAELESAVGLLRARWPDPPQSSPSMRVFVRPEHVEIGPSGAFDGRANVFDGEVTQTVFLGASTAYHLKLPNDLALVAQVPNRADGGRRLAVGARVAAHIPAEAVKPLRD